MSNADLQPLVASITQREKFLLADRLGRPFHELIEDPDRVLLAVAWVKRKRESNGAPPSWDELLDLTDEQLLAELGIDPNADQEDDDTADPLAG